MTSLVVWDHVDDPPDGDTVLWRSYGEASATSLPRIVERDENSLRRRILAALHDVAAAPVDGATLVDALAIRPGLSYWWMSLPAAKRWGGTGVVADAVKLLAFSDLLATHPDADVVVHSDRPTVSRAISRLCASRNVACRVVGSGARSTARLPTLRAIVHLGRRIVPRHPANRDPGGVSRWTLFGYYFRVRASDTTFTTDYFGPLPSLAVDHGVGVTWVHRFAPNDSTPRPRSAWRTLARRDEPHHLIDTLTPLEALRATVLYANIRRRAARFRPEQVLRGDAAIVWPLFSAEWDESRRSSHAMACAAAVVRFERLLRRLPRQELGLYVMENQPWEFALQHAWRVAGHGTLIGVPHSSIRRWDLRYEVDPRDAHLGGHPWSRPDLVAANGPLADVALETNPVLAPLSRPVEALMYLSLAEPLRDRGERIVVLGELDIGATERLLARVATLTANDATPPMFKPHPQHPVSDRWSDRFEVTDSPLRELLRQARVVVMGGSGTAMLEAVTLGVPVIVCLDGAEIDLRPVRRHPSITVTRTTAELHRALDEVTDASHRDHFFRLDASLPGWRSLLNLDV